MELKQILKFCIESDVLLVASEEFDVVRFLSFSEICLESTEGSQPESRDLE